MKQNYLLIIFISLFACSQKHSKFELLDAAATGVQFANTITESDSMQVMKFEYIYNGGGVGIADLNNDSLPDLIFTGNQVASRVYLNRGNLHFEDITDALSGQDTTQWCSGISVVDINNDGWTDLYFTCTAYSQPDRRKNRLWINKGIQQNGKLKFVEEASKYGIADENYGVHSAFFDYDLDGDLDLYILNNFVTERMSASYRPKILDGSAINNDKLYRNNGDGTFSDVSVNAGIVYEGFGLGIAVGDVNKDGYPDLYISDDYISNDLLYINQGDGTFKNEIAKYMSYQTKSSMGNDMADINNDGFPDMYTMDMMPEHYYKKKQTINGFSYAFYLNDKKYGYEHQYLRNMLHLNNGLVHGELAPFSEVGQMLGIYQTEWSWSPLFADYDNDGDKDLLVTNGYPKDMTDKDWTKYKSAVFGYVASAQHVINKAPALKVPNLAFENTGNLTFRQRTDDWFEARPSFSYGAAFADLDNDGDLDYVVNNIDEKAFIYKNTSVEQAPEKSNFIDIRLRSNGKNRFALGAKVEVWSGGKYQYQEHYLSRGYISSVDPEIHFGLGSNTLLDSLKVTWPASQRQTILKNVKANIRIDLVEEDATKQAVSNPVSTEKNALFSMVDSVLNYKHEQEDYIDFFLVQNILPHKFSQIGPKMTRGDIDGDGLDDIVIGATNALPTKVFVRKGNRFIPQHFEGLTEKKPFSEADFAIGDFDLDGDNDVIAIAGGYENRKDDDYVHYLYQNEGGTFRREALPIAHFIGAVVRSFDFDHDGDLDLFIGSRVKKFTFPFASDSWILINNKGHFDKDNVMKFNLGMVTDALWSDVDGDGWEDLMIAREWNSVVILKSKKGEGFTSLENDDLEAHHGIWYSIKAADLDGDGDDDYLLGNLGVNHRFTVSDQYPLHIYAVDVDRNGSLDPIMTGFWEDIEGNMKEYPVNYLDELRAQTKVFTDRYKNYTSFSKADIHDLLDTTIMNRVNYAFYVNTTYSYVLWNDGGKFRWQKMPRLAQTSPLKKFIVHDLNNDKIPDVIMAGNDYTYDVSTGYYDANKGLVWLSKDGKPLQKLLKPAQSGLALQGMVESLLFFDGQNPLLIAGYNRQKVQSWQVHTQTK